MKKSLIFWFAAVTCAAWILVGCEQEPETKTVTVTVPEMIHLDVFATDEPGLIAALAKTGDLNIGLSQSVTLGAALTIPNGKLVYILNGGGLDASSKLLTVEGQVYVGLGGTLTATATGGVAVTNGIVHVVKGGTLVTDTAASVNDGAAAPATVLGTAKASFATGGSLGLTGTLADITAVGTALGYVGKGTLDLSSATITTAPKPSEAVAAFNAKSATGLIINANGTESAAPLTIPAGLDLTTTDALASITGLTVNGTLDVSTAGTLAALTTLTVNGDLTVKDTIKVASVTGTGNITFSNAATFAAATTFGNTGLTTFENTFTFNKSDGGVVFEGDVVFEEDVTLTAGFATFKKTAFFADTKKLTLTAATSVVKLADGTGALAVGAPVAGVPDIYSTILKADDGADAVLTPAANTTLTFTASGKVLTQGASGTNNHGITLTGGATLISGSSYVVESAADKIGTLTVTGTLTLGPEVLEPTGYENEAAPKLVLTGAATTNGALLKGSGSVVAGGTTIVGDDDGWQAVGTGTVTIAKDAITASASTVALTAQHADAAITVTASRLAVTGEITLATGTKGKLTLKGDDTTAGSLLLKGNANNAGKLRVAADSNTVKVGATVTSSDFLIFAASGMSATTQAYVTAANGTGVTPANLSVNGGNTDASSGTTLSSITAGNEVDTKDVLITGQVAEANALTIANGAYVKVTNSDA